MVNQNNRVTTEETEKGRVFDAVVSGRSVGVIFFSYWSMSSSSVRTVFHVLDLQLTGTGIRNLLKGLQLTLNSWNVFTQSASHL